MPRQGCAVRCEQLCTSADRHATAGTARLEDDMAIDITGAMDPSSDHFLAERPDDPEFRESVSFWISDDEGALGLPRVGIEAVASEWDKRGLQLNLGFADGRALIVRDLGEGRSPVDEDGVCRTFAAGALVFRHVKPFERLTVSYEGPALDTTFEAMVAGDAGGRQANIHVEVELECALPPWVSGTLTHDAVELFNEGFAGAFISPRYEQLCTARGNVEVGTDDWAFIGTALRIHRQGRRDTTGFWGHCWPSALFPSGKGFGALAFPERPDGQPTFNEGFVFLGERMIPATLVKSPWISRLQASGEDVSLTLRTVDGIDVHIEGETLFTNTIPAGSSEFAPALQQAGVRYRWDGEVTYGMMERSMPIDKLQR
jgi:hypothetical protein